ncbi:MAG: phosphate regulon transcriptional regulator PhoB [Alphaproteobacteria bacterium]|jgi:two-component system phosphate regulon response regulator PhoB|nr:phosphate regulon transcriptional regulator PhoB [Rickettsiales bacterium]
MAQIKDEKTKVLIVEDEVAIVTLLRYNLEKEGFTVITTGDGEEAVRLVKDHRPDVIVLDWMLPGMTGIEVCKHIRWNQDVKNTPIIMLSARGEEGDRIRGLDSGADDYMVKPFSPPELISRIRAVFRRIRPSLSEKVLEFSGIILDLTSHKATRDGTDVHFSPTEFGLLRHMMEHPGRVFSREQLLDAVWGHDIYVELRTVDVHIRRLRRALNYDGKQPDLIRTVRSAGYALEENPGGVNYTNPDQNEAEA